MGSKLASSILLPAHIHATDLLLGKFIFLSLFQLGVQIVGPCKERVSRKNNEKVGVESKGTLFFPFHLFFLNCSLSLLRAALYHRNAWNRLNFVNIARTTKKKIGIKRHQQGLPTAHFCSMKLLSTFVRICLPCQLAYTFPQYALHKCAASLRSGLFFFFFSGKEEKKNASFCPRLPLKGRRTS